MVIGNYENKIFKLNYDFKGHKKGDKIKIRTKDGIPIDTFWRERFIDSKVDDCIELVENKNKITKKEVK